MPNLVRHPETGKPAYEQVSYQEVERGQLENDVNNHQDAVNNTGRELEEARALVAEREDAHTKAQAALEESKSNLGAYDSIAPQPQPDESAEGTGGENENATEGGEATEIPVQQVQF